MTAVPARTGGDSRMPASQRIARDKAIEKARARYLILVCGHYCAREVREIYAVFAASEFDVWCEKCQDWRQVKPREIVTIPENPLF